MTAAAPDRLVDLPLTERVAGLRREIDRIAARFDALSDSDLEHPAMGDWSIAEVIAHLALVPEFYADSVARGAEGDAAVAGDRPAAGTGRGEIVAAGVKRGAAGVAEGGDVRARFVRSAHALADALDGEEADLSYDCYHPGGIVPANRFLVLYSKELGLHEWDVFEALSPPATMSPWGTDAAYTAMEEEIASGSLRWVTAAEPPTGSIRVRVTTAGAVAAERFLVVDADGTRLVPASGDPDGRLDIDAADFVLACSGRLDLAEVVRSGRATGDLAQIEAIAGRFTGM